MARFTNDNVELDPDALSDAEKAQLKRLDEVVRRIDALQMTRSRWGNENGPIAWAVANPYPLTSANC